MIEKVIFVCIRASKFRVRKPFESFSGGNRCLFSTETNTRGDDIEFLVNDGSATTTLGFLNPVFFQKPSLKVTNKLG